MSSQPPQGPRHSRSVCFLHLSLQHSMCLPQAPCTRRSVNLGAFWQHIGDISNPILGMYVCFSTQLESFVRAVSTRQGCGTGLEDAVPGSQFLRIGPLLSICRSPTRRHHHTFLPQHMLLLLWEVDILPISLPSAPLGHTPAS